MGLLQLRVSIRLAGNGTLRIASGGRGKVLEVVGLDSFATAADHGGLEERKGAGRFLGRCALLPGPRMHLFGRLP